MTGKTICGFVWRDYFNMSFVKIQSKSVESSGLSCFSVLEYKHAERRWIWTGVFSRCGATPFLLAEKKWGKETARGDLFRGGPLWTPSPTTKGGCGPPLDSPIWIPDRISVRFDCEQEI